MNDGDVLFEFVRIGVQMRVAAIHSGTGIEVVVVVPSSATQSQMQQFALAKLKRKLAERPTPPERRLF
ncbi:DUF6898 family protein [Devosia sp.]|uniref:DUF6898 family protein n=1 Tax=Devosia sp. TaxID=1871048 RepID=UPI003263FE15